MKNKVLVTTLALCTAVCTVIADYVYTGQIYDERSAEIERYEQLDADPNTLYCGYTIEQLGEGYEKPESVFGKVSIDVPIINQFPELPIGCEITSATAVLQYLGFDVDKIYMTENYLPWDDNFTYDENMVSHGPDPYKVFAGNPYDWGYGCFAPVITESLNTFFISNDPDYEALSLENINEADIEKLINEGVPMIVWASRGMKPYKYREPATWLLNDTGEEFNWIGNSHTLVLCGYDSNCYYFMDCDDKTEITAYSKENFLNRFEENGSQCVVVKINN
ncbi:MAG: C39 family peptidase [Oscillospiraceae bacterium]|nr:C39 family peptidase [Oscillospiraceae bacterium]